MPPQENKKNLKKILRPMRNCGKLATCDAVLVFNDVNMRNVKKETDWIHTRFL
jgi:hypothetical protein